MKRPLTPTLLSLLLTIYTTSAHAQENPTDLIKKAVQAHGGEEKLLKLSAMKENAKGTIQAMGLTLPFTTETIVQFPQQIKTVVQIDIQGNKAVVVQVLNGAKGWVAYSGQTKEVTGPLLGEMKETLHATRVQSLLPLLKEDGFTLTSVKDARVGGRPAAGVKVSAKGHKDITLYFDRQNNLLVKCERKALDDNQVEVFRETVMSDYKEIDGVKTATKIVFTNDGAKYVDSVVTGVQFLDKVEPKEFNRP